MKTIILFTGSYPYDHSKESTFLEPELRVLNNSFNIILVPFIKKGKKSDFIDGLIL